MAVDWYGIVIMAPVKSADLWPLAEFLGPVTGKFIRIISEQL